MNKCSICMSTKYDALFSSCEHCICAGCLHKEIFSNFSLFMNTENSEEQMCMNCVICNEGEFLINKNAIYQVLESLNNPKEEIHICGKCPEDLQSGFFVFCKTCKLKLCQTCFFNHPQEHIFTKNPKPINTNCYTHSDQSLLFECRTCCKPICLVCQTLDHKGHRVVYIKDAIVEIKEKISKKLAYDSYENFNLNFREEQNKIKDDIKQKSKEFTNKIENIIAELFEIISNYKNKISIFEEKFKNSTINLNILYKNFYEDLQNTRDEDYLNLYLLSKLQDDYGRINLTKHFGNFNFSIGSETSIQLNKIIEELLGFINPPVPIIPKNPPVPIISKNLEYKKINSTQIDEFKSSSNLLEASDNHILVADLKGLDLYELTNNNSLNMKKQVSFPIILTKPPVLLQLENGEFVLGSEKLEIYDTNLNILDEIHLNNEIHINENIYDDIQILCLCNTTEKSIVVGFRNGNIKIFNRNNVHRKFSEVINLKGHAHDVSSLIYLNNQEYLLSGSLGEIKIWNLSQQNTPIKTLLGLKDYVNSLISLNDEYVASCCKDIKIWSIYDKFECVKTISMQWDSINLKSIGQNLIVFSSRGKKFKFWKTEHPYNCLETYDEDSEIENLLVTRNYSIVTLTKDNKLNIWKSSS